MSNTRQQLAQAYELILRDRVSEAYNLVKPITEAEPDNPDAWWLLANATEEPTAARRALITVLKLNPAHPKARGLLDQLNEAFPPSDSEIMQMMAIEDIEPDMVQTTADFVDDPFEEEDDLFADVEAKPAKKPSRPTSEIDDLFDEDDFGSDGDDPFASLLDEDAPQEDSDMVQAGATKPRRRRTPLLLLLILSLVCVGAAFLLTRGGGSDEPSSEVVAWTSVEPATVNAEAVENLEGVRFSLEQATQGQFSPESQAFYVQTPDGFGLVVRLCAEPTPNLPRMVQDSMNLVASRTGNTPDLETYISHVGLVIEDCARGNDILYRALSPWSAARDYVQALGDAQAFSNFRQTWQVES